MSMVHQLDRDSSFSKTGKFISYDIMFIIGKTSVNTAFDRFKPLSDFTIFQAYVPERQNDYATYSQRGKRPFCNAFEGKKTNMIEPKSNLYHFLFNESCH